MYAFLLRTEAKIFCLCIIAFLFFFQKASFQKQSSEYKLIYILLIAGDVFSVLTDFNERISIQFTCFGLSWSSYVLSAAFFCRYIFKTSYIENTKTVKTVIISGFIVFGIISFCVLGYKMNTASYIVVAALVITFIIEQYNKIRIDNLTKLYNRYGMDAELKEQLRQYEKENSDSFYIIACDLDNFKHINDTWGHLEGDRALVLIAGVLSKIGKKYSSGVFRIGGDEFVIITDTSEDGLALDVTNEIKKELDRLEFRDDFDIKMSIGVALYDGKTPIDELLNSADKKLYEAKKNK